MANGTAAQAEKAAGWPVLITFTLPGEPVPMPQGKVVYCKNMPNAAGGKGRMVKIVPKLVTDWQGIIRSRARQAMGGQAPYLGPVLAGFCYYRSRPKKVTSAWDVPIQRPDLENLDELVADAITGTIYKDDSQIVGHLGWPAHGKHYADECGPRTRIVIVSLDAWRDDLAKEVSGTPHLWKPLLNKQREAIE